jgi:hypothetical protein
MSVLKGRKSFYDYEVSDALAYNVKTWLDYGLLETGAYTVVNFSNPSTSGYTNLERTYDDRYGGHGRVYEGLGPGWVWENDVTPVDGGIAKPLVASGIRVNNVFYPTGSTSGTYAHTIDFRHGRVIFQSSIPTPDNVQCEYTFRDVATYLVDDPEWKTIESSYLEKFPKMQELSPSGMAQLLKDNRVWLPAVVVEVGNRTNLPLQQGGGDINVFEVNYHIFSDNSFSNRRLADILNNQYQTTINLYDINNLQFPYRYDGSVPSGSLTYPVLSNREGSHFWTYAYIEETTGGPMHSVSDTYRAEVMHTIQVDRYMITF